jgi:ion channel-forming bestrophin family protein
MASHRSSPTEQLNFTPNPSRQPTAHSLELDDFFRGPRDIKHHSKVPYFFRIHGSIIPKLIIPQLIVICWATAITVISKLVYPLAVNSVLLTVLGFVVGLALSFRSSTAYERYIEGARLWATLMLASRNLARLLWIHTNERHKEDPSQGKADLWQKVTAINLIKGFAVALKHRLRFEAAPDYADLSPFISALDVMVSNADDISALHPQPSGGLKRAGEYLGVSFAESNPRKTMKKATFNIGNIPQEILIYLQSYLEHIASAGLLTNGPLQSNIVTQLGMFAQLRRSCASY